VYVKKERDCNMQPQTDIFGFACTCLISKCTVRFLSYYNQPNLKVGNTNSTQGILRVVVTGNVKVSTDWMLRGIIVVRPFRVYFYSYFTFHNFNIYNRFNCVRYC